MSDNGWITDAHLTAVADAVRTTSARGPKQRLVEVLVQLHHLRRAGQQGALEAADRQAPLTAGDLDEVQVLMGKGIAHNGLVPQLDAQQVGRALGVLAELLARAAIGALTEDQLDALTWVFDVATQESPEDRRNLRQLEALVRGGLGLPSRIEVQPHRSLEPS